MHGAPNVNELCDAMPFLRDVPPTEIANHLMQEGLLITSSVRVEHSQQKLVMDHAIPVYYLAKIDVSLQSKPILFVELGYL